MTKENKTSNYSGRYPLLKYRKGIWREIVRYVHKDTGSVESVVELGAGYCDFINQFPAELKIAFDLNPEMEFFAEKHTEFHISDAENIGKLEPNSIDLVFASNFLEHLNEFEHERLMPSIYRGLKSGGRLILIQPNYRRCKNNYFDDETHRTIFSDKNIGTFLEHHGFIIKKLIPGLLPFSMKSRFPKWPILTRLYLMSPTKPLAAQMYVIAEKG